MKYQAAFPRGPDQWEGMDLRDWFAGKAMEGILSGPCSRDGVPATEWLDIPNRAYEIADKMLKEREK